ncbi:MAG: 4-(cytidine 5'-diphospho)-2-C-methyl-D-erythritol kinase [Gaiellaceae bacterium]
MIGAAPAKLNLALVVGAVRGDGMHDLVTVYQRLDVCDRITVEPADETAVEGFDDTIVRRALSFLPGHWHVRIDKQIPVAAGLGGGSSDAATALRLANAQLDPPLTAEELHAVAAQVGADVPFFLRDGPQLGTGDGTELEALDLPQDFAVLLLLPHGERKQSTAEVYAAFDARGGAAGFRERVAAVRSVLAGVRRPRDLAALPPNDLARSPHVDLLLGAGAFRADVSGAGPTLYGLFGRAADAERAQRSLRRLGRSWVTVPAWYG